MTGRGGRSPWRRRHGPLTCSRCHHVDERGLALSADGQQLLCHECSLREQRWAERHGNSRRPRARRDRTEVVVGRNTARTWGDRAGPQGATQVQCPLGHLELTRTETGRMIRCAQCAAGGVVTWILIADSNVSARPA